MSKDVSAKNKKAWEESFSLRKTGWGEDIPERLERNLESLVEPECVDFLKKNDLKGACIAQFCCNNGRDLMGIVKMSNASCGIGFDIGENILKQAKDNALKAKLPCEFVQTDIADISEEYYDKFDALFVIVGALCWFSDLNLFFKKASQCLKKNGLLFIHEIHPATFMPALSSEQKYDARHPLEPKHSYFSKKPFITNDAMEYLSDAGKQQNAFYSYAYTMSDIVNALSSNGFFITGMQESDVDLGGDFEKFSHSGYPMTILVTARKI